MSSLEMSQNVASEINKLVTKADTNIRCFQHVKKLIFWQRPGLHSWLASDLLWQWQNGWSLLPCSCVIVFDRKWCHLCFSPHLWQEMGRPSVRLSACLKIYVWSGSDIHKLIMSSSFVPICNVKYGFWHMRMRFKSFCFVLSLSAHPGLALQNRGPISHLASVWLTADSGHSFWLRQDPKRSGRAPFPSLG